MISVKNYFLEASVDNIYKNRFSLWSLAELQFWYNGVKMKKLHILGHQNKLSVK